MKKPYTKPGKDPKELLEKLKSKGLIIEDDHKAIQYIQNIGYFRLKAYFYPLYQEPKQNHQFKPQSTFGQALSMYRFDRKLRLLLFNEIEKIEVALRSALVNIVTDELNDVFWMTKPEYFKNEDYFQTTWTLIRNEYDKSKEEFILHFKGHYSDPFPPAWMIAEILPFGNLSYIYSNLKSERVKKRVAKYFGLQAPVLSSWILVLSNLRNLCGHHARTWNRELAINTSNPTHTAYPWIDVAKTNPKRIYYRICMIRYLLYTVSPQNKFKSKLKALMTQYPSIDISAIGFPVEWESEPLWQYPTAQQGQTGRAEVRSK